MDCYFKWILRENTDNFFCHCLKSTMHEAGLTICMGLYAPLCQVRLIPGKFSVFQNLFVWWRWWNTCWLQKSKIKNTDLTLNQINTIQSGSYPKYHFNISMIAQVNGYQLTMDIHYQSIKLCSNSFTNLHICFS